MRTIIKSKINLFKKKRREGCSEGPDSVPKWVVETELKHRLQVCALSGSCHPICPGLLPHGGAIRVPE